MSVAVSKTSSKLGTYFMEGLRTVLKEKHGLKEMAGNHRDYMIDIIRKYLGDREAQRVKRDYVLYYLPRDSATLEILERLVSELGEQGDEEAIKIYDALTLGLGELAKQNRLPQI